MFIGKALNATLEQG